MDVKIRTNQSHQSKDALLEYYQFRIDAMLKKIDDLESAIELKDAKFEVLKKIVMNQEKEIKKLKKPKKVKKMMQILQHYYMKYEYFNSKWFFNDPNKVKYSVGGYHNLSTLVLYKYWTANFDLKAHDKKYQQLEQFINSGNYNYAAHDK